MQKSFCFFLFLVIAGCASNEPPSSSPGIEEAWTKAHVYLPNSWFPKRPRDVALDNPLPVVVYLHGCDGIDTAHDSAWAKFIASLGYAVVMPDSMARPYRVPNCDDRLKKATNKFPLALAYREHEIDLAWQKLQNYDWVRKDKIFLMGHSEGGVAVAHNKSDRFIGLIISGWTCTSRGRGHFSGIMASKNIPVLAISNKNDIWFQGTNLKGQCSEHSANRVDFTQIDLTNIGSEHSTYQSSSARAAVSSFLKRLTVD